MSYEEAIQLYTDKFGGFPYFLCMGMSESDIVKIVEDSISSGEEIKPKGGVVY